MNFASALFSLKRGYKIKRKHWTGWWELDGNEVMMVELSILGIQRILYTLSKTWRVTTGRTIADNCGAKGEI